MKLYVVDWGKDCKGARYAFVSADSRLDLFDLLDEVGDPCQVRFCAFGSGIYVPFGVKTEVFAGGDENEPALSTIEYAVPDQADGSGYSEGQTEIMHGLAADIADDKLRWRRFRDDITHRYYAWLTGKSTNEKED